MMTDVTDGIRDSNKILIFPEVSLKKMFSIPNDCSRELNVLLQNLYKWSNTCERRVDDLPDNFLTENPETIWQFVAHKNKQINKDWKQYKYLLEEPIGIIEERSESDPNESNVSIDDSIEEEDGFSDGLNESMGMELDESIEKEEHKSVKSDQKVLLGQKTADAESKLKSDIRKLQESIRKLEEENLQPRSWELSGEVAADQREENALLETFVQFDNNKKRAPEISEDFTEKLEALIKQRIKDQAFDDVKKLKKVDDKVNVYRNGAIEEREFIKKSLAEVYEKEYQQLAGEVNISTKENPMHKSIEEKMNKLFLLVDAMAHFEYTPPAVLPELAVVSNMAALRTEEVSMQASTDAQLLAPEEIKKKIKGDLKAEDERTKTDKLRQRRKKKTKQRIMAGKFGFNKVLPGKNESAK